MKYYQTIPIALLLVVAFTGTASARTPAFDASLNASANATSGMNARMKDDQRRMELKSRASSTRERWGDKMCSKLTERIEDRLTRFDQKYYQHNAIYERYKANLLLISAKLEAKGIATAKLKANIALFDQKIAKLAADKAKVKKALEDSQAFSCGDETGQFKAAIEAARTAQKEVVADAADIAAFIRGTLKQDIKDLRGSSKASASSSASVRLEN